MPQVADAALARLIRDGTVELDKTTARARLDAVRRGGGRQPVRRSSASHLSPGAVYTPGAVREVLGVSRKYLMSVLEFLDREGLTEKTLEGRRWRAPLGTSRATSPA